MGSLVKACDLATIESEIKGNFMSSRSLAESIMLYSLAFCFRWSIAGISMGLFVFKLIFKD